MPPSDQPTNVTNVKSLSGFIQLNPPPVLLAACQPDLVKEVQGLLNIETDGKVGPITRQAFAEFKLENNLEFSIMLDTKVAQELLKLKGQTAEAGSADSIPVGTPKLNPDAGSRSGTSMKLPTGEVVYANQYVIEGIPLTWGELTKDCARVPTAKEYVDNAIKLTKTWGTVREKFGSPIRITSAYRPPKVNVAQGGARNSQHLYFRALDMQPFNSDFKKLWAVLEASEFTGLGDAVFRGRNKGFFHGDIRPSQRVVFSY